MRESEAHRFNQGIWSQGGNKQVFPKYNTTLPRKKKNQKQRNLSLICFWTIRGVHVQGKNSQKLSYPTRNLNQFYVPHLQVSFITFLWKKTVQSMEFSYFLCISLFTLKIFRSYRFINNFTIAKTYNTAPPFITLLTKLHFSNSKTVLEIPFVPCWSSLITPKEVRW